MISAATPDVAAVRRPISCHAVESLIREVWAEHFGHEVGPDDDFYELGGDSLNVVDVVLAARQRGLDVRASLALRHSTPARLAESLTLGAGSAGAGDVPALRAPAESLRGPVWTVADLEPVPIVPGGGVPLFVVHSHSHVRAERDAIVSWATGGPAWGLLLPGGRGAIPPIHSVADVADRLAAAIRPHLAGPVRLAGFGQGAAVAFEVARRLSDANTDVRLLVLIDPPEVGRPTQSLEGVLDQLIDRHARRFGLDGTESLADVHAEMSRAGWFRATAPDDLPRLHLAASLLEQALRAYRPAVCRVPAVLFQDVLRAELTDGTWAPVLPNAVVHRTNYGITSPRAVLLDPTLAATMRRMSA